MTVKKLLEELVVWAEGERPLDIVVQAVEQGRSAMAIRIFNDQRGTKDIVGKGLGKYSNPYAELRKARGLQAKVIDLNFTGSLQRDIKTVRNGEKITIAVPSEGERKKIGYIEKRYNTNIFDLSKDEKKEVMSAIKFNLDKDFEEIIGKYL